jgi:fibronectin type III domain protein
VRPVIGALPLLASIVLASVPVTLASFNATTSSPNNAFTNLVVQPATLSAPVTAAAGVVQLTWTASPTAATESVNYAVFRSPAGAGAWSQIASLTGLSYSDVPPADGSWDYYVQSVVTVLTSDSNVGTGVSDRTAPTSPTGVTAATGTLKGTIAVAWTAGTDAGSGVAGYTVHYVQTTTPCPAAAPASYPLTTSPITGTNVTLSGLTTAKTYCIYVTTTDRAGNISGPSATASAKAK